MYRALPASRQYSNAAMCFVRCPQVREAVSVLDLDVDVRPCPKGGSVWRNKVVEMGGKAQFPYLVDENTGEGQRGWGGCCSIVYSIGGAVLDMVLPLHPL
jgi:hypothetical protein